VAGGQLQRGSRSAGVSRLTMPTCFLLFKRY